MGYYSPFHFLPADIDMENPDPATLQRAKKKLLAELEIDENALGGMTKDQMLKWFDSLNPLELKYHHFIFHHKPLLNFLEQGSLRPNNWYMQLHAPPEIQDFILPKIQQQYDHLITEAFRNADRDAIIMLSNFQLPDLQTKGRYYYTGALNLFTAYYHQWIQLAANYSPDKAAAIREFLSQPFISVIPHMPPYLAAMRDEFALAVAKFAGELCENPDPDKVQLARWILGIVENLGVSEATEKEIEFIKKQKVETDEALKVDQTQQDQSLSARGGCWKLVKWIVFVIIILRLIMFLIGSLK